MRSAEPVSERAVSVEVAFKVHRLSGRRGAAPWDGLRVGLRAARTGQLYSAGLMRRDGRLVVQKWCAGSNGSKATSATLASMRGSPRQGDWTVARFDVWEDERGATQLRLLVSGGAVLRASDRSVGCSSIAAPGFVVVAGDSARVSFDFVRISAARPTLTGEAWVRETSRRMDGMPAAEVWLGPASPRRRPSTREDEGPERQESERVEAPRRHAEPSPSIVPAQQAPAPRGTPTPGRQGAAPESEAAEAPETPSPQVGVPPPPTDAGSDLGGPDAPPVGALEG